MIDNSVTGVFDNEVHYLLKNYTYEGNIFYLLDLSASNKLITGNKAWKLKYNLDTVLKNGYKGVVTFGGAYSNHIYQTALLGRHFNIRTVGLIRGEINDRQNPTLYSARLNGMYLQAIDRSTYRRRNDENYINNLTMDYPDHLIVPEGGTNALAIQGTSDLGIMVNNLCENVGIHQIALPVGSGGTIAGIINGSTKKQVVGYSALKGDFINKDIAKWLKDPSSTWGIKEEIRFGGYAKWDNELIEFIKDFHKQTGVALDPIYTGKMIFRALHDGVLDRQTLFIHTGGIQGNRGFNQRFGLELPIA